MKARWEVMKITVGSEETLLLGKALKRFPRNPARVNDLNRVVNSSKTEILAQRAGIDQAIGLYYRKET